MTTKTIVQDWSETGFEGPEKLLEVWFAPSSHHLPEGCVSGGLKSVKQDVWESMLDLVQCKVLSVINSSEIDAYLLSESSMFVFPHKIILKTCGTTTLLVGLQRLLYIAVELVGLRAQPWKVFYSRKNFIFPEAQKAPHKTWQDEMNYLDQHFENGSAYQIGPMNGDHWFLYIFGNDHVQMVATGHHKGSDEFEDETLEILMTRLDRKQAQQFYMPAASVDSGIINQAENDGVPKGTEYSACGNSEGHRLGVISAKLSGLKSICCRSDTAVMDSFQFDPLGLSANMVDCSKYATIHITPEPECSYASFETNMSGIVKDLPRVLDVFGPGNFTMTRFSTKRDGETKDMQIDGYKRLDLIQYELDGYFLEFQNWRKK